MDEDKKILIWTALTSQQICSKKEIKRHFTSLGENAKMKYLTLVPLDKWAMALRHFDFIQVDLVRYLVKTRKQAESTIRQVMHKISRELKALFGLDYIAKCKEEIQKFKNIKKVNSQADVSSIVDNLKPVLSIFSVKHEDLKKRLEAIREDGVQSDEDYLKQLYILRQLFIAKAHGDIVTQQTETLYEVDEDDDGNIVDKRIYVNKGGKKVVNVKTQSYLPDEKALVGAKIVEEMILQIKNASQTTISTEELENLYEKYREKQEILKINAIIQERN